MVLHYDASKGTEQLKSFCHGTYSQLYYVFWSFILSVHIYIVQVLHTMYYVKYMCK